MRVKQPLLGLERAIGHIGFHIAFLICSFMLHIDMDKNEQIDVNFEELIQMIRYMHIFVIVSVYFRALVGNKDTSIFLRIPHLIEVFVYYSVFLYLQFEMTKYDFGH